MSNGETSNKSIAENVRYVLTGIIDGIGKANEQTKVAYKSAFSIKNTIPMKLTAHENGEVSVEIGMQLFSLSEKNGAEQQ